MKFRCAWAPPKKGLSSPMANVNVFQRLYRAGTKFPGLKN